MNSPSSKRCVLIFGGAGFIGSNWASYLLTHTDANVHVFDNQSRRRVEHNLRWLQNLVKGTDRFKVSIADIRDLRAVEKAVSRASEIYHFAAQVAVTTSLEDPRNDFEINAAGTFNILEAARKSGNLPFLLFTSTNKVYGKVDSTDQRALVPLKTVSESQPLDFFSPYGCSKGTADQYVRDYSRIFGLPTVVFRMSCIAGPRQFGNEDQGWVAHFVYSALQGRTISIYGDGHQVRDVLAIRDLLRAFEAAYENRRATAGQVYNIGGGVQNAISLLELIRKLERILKVRISYQFSSARPGDQPIYVTDFSKFRGHSRWSPERSVMQTLQDICAWYRGNESLFGTTAFPAPSRTLPAAEALREIAS